MKRELQNHNKRLLLKNLICQDLGYCCEWIFFKRFKQTGLLAARLGVTSRAIRYHKAQFKNGEFQCKGYEKCMKDSLKGL